jgi:hypothetical protein
MFFGFLLDGFMPGEQYPEIYNSLQKMALERGIIKESSCPEKFI